MNLHPVGNKGKRWKWTEEQRLQITGDKSPKWKGGLSSSGGYRTVRTSSGCQRSEHVLIAEKVLGRKLKSGEQVHHINGVKTDNRNCNLLICTNGYHQYLHHRMAELYMKEHFCAI